jgi:hypothetical protein
MTAHLKATNYGYFINEHQYDWPAPDRLLPARSRTFIGWRARNGKTFN